MNNYDNEIKMKINQQFRVLLDIIEKTNEYQTIKFEVQECLRVPEKRNEGIPTVSIIEVSIILEKILTN